jgi:YD repeat-containing protein
MTYEWLGGAYRCGEIKDRNGNFITIDHDEDGTLRTVTDTLGRVITVNYDSQLYPTSITQTWKGTNGSGSNVTHTWASFTYTTKTVATSFGSLTVVGPPNDTVMKVLQKVTYADGSYTKFTHNGYIQVEKVENYAADDHLLNHTRTNLDSVSGTQSDCPRFTHTYTKVDNFNLNGSGVPQEIDVENLEPASSSFTGPNGSESTSMVKVTMAGHPDNLYTRIHYDRDRGLHRDELLRQKTLDVDRMGPG